MKRRGPPEIVADLDGGEIVRIDAGLVRILHRVQGGKRWALLLRDNLAETDDKIWLGPSTRIVEVIALAPQRKVDGEEVDPLRGGRDGPRVASGTREQGAARMDSRPAIGALDAVDRGQVLRRRKARARGPEGAPGLRSVSAVTARWRCPLCGEYQWFTRSCRPCQDRILAAIYERFNDWSRSVAILLGGGYQKFRSKSGGESN